VYLARFGLRCALALALLAGALPSPAVGAAPEDSEMAALDPDAVPLTALPLGDAPGATTVITAEEIERSAAANIFELLRRVPGVDIRYTPMGGHIGIRSNGSSPFSEEVLLLIDGSPYNSPGKGGFPGHPNYVGFFPLDRIARIEVIKGPISVVYGANAFGGVVNIVSKQAADAVTEGVDGYAYGATVLVGNRNTFERRVRAAMVKGGLDATLEVGFSDGNTPIQLNGDAEHERSDIYAAVRRGNFSASFLHQENRNGSFPFINTETKKAFHNVDILDAHYQRRVGGWVLQASGSFNRYRGTTCAVCHNNLSGPPDDAVTSDVGLEREVDQRIYASFRADRTLADSQDLNVGLVASHDTVDRDIVKIEGSPSTMDSSGVFLQHQLHMRRGTVHLISGIRSDSIYDHGSAVSPRIALVAEPTDDVTLRASWSRAYRAPSWNERYIQQRFIPEEVAPGLIVVFYGNPDLERERIDSAAAGVSWRLPGDVVVRADLYRNRIHDFIFRGEPVFEFGDSSELQLYYENSDDDFTLRGGELSVLARPSKEVSLTVGYGSRSISLPIGDPRSAYTPKHRAMINAAWTPGRWTFDLAGSYSSGYTVSSPQIFGLRPQPSYELVDAAARYAFPVARGRIEIGLVGRNVFDEHPKETLVNDEVNTALRGRVVAFELRADF
jgi:outer membrane receptor protein involved in Fe transport